MADDQTPAESGADTHDQSSTTTPPDAPADAAKPAAEAEVPEPAGEGPARKQAAPRKKAAARKRPAKKAAPSEQTTEQSTEQSGGDAGAPEAPTGDQPAADQPAADQPAADKPVVKKTTRKRTTKKTAAPPAEAPADDARSADVAPEAASGQDDGRPTAPTVLFQPPPAEPAPARRTKAEPVEGDADTSETAAVDASTGDASTGDTEDGRTAQRSRPGKGRATGGQGSRSGSGAQGRSDDGAAPRGDQSDDQADEDSTEQSDDGQDDSGADDGAPRRRRRRGGRRRRGKGGQDGNGQDDESDEADSSDSSDSSDGDSDEDESGDDSEQSQSSSSRRRRRRRRSGEGGDDSSGESDGGGGSGGGGTKVRSARAAEDEITSFTGSTRLEAKKQRRREGREAGRRRAPVISEAEFLARRESVNRKMVVRQRDDLTQIAVMEDKVLVEHYVARESQTSLIGNVYLGKVQNVLPSMEAAFIDIGRGRNAVLYAGEVNWDSLGAGSGGKERKIEQVLKPGQSVLVQVSKDPIGHKGARLTSQISLPGRFLVYVPEGNTSGISRKLPDTERNRLKTLLKEIVPSEAGVIVRTAAEGAAEEELRRDVARLTARWDDIKSKVEGGNAPQELYSEPDLTLKVVRDLFTEDIGELVVSGTDAWDMVSAYVDQVAPDLAERLTQHDDSEADAFAAYRIDEQIAKALERKVWLPSGGSLIIDRTEAMTVVDVNTGKFTGSGGNLEETVTKNNLEAAEEIVRQLRLRDIGGIIVIDFIDMVLEGNRDLVLRRLIECLGRDRTRHQVAEVTSLGLVQMTRKRIGTGLLEAFSEQCEHCQGRGYHVHAEPVEQKKRTQDDDSRRGRRGKRGRSDDQDNSNGGNGDGRGGGGGDRNGRGARSGNDERKGGRSGDNGSGETEQGDNGARRPTPAEFAAMASRQAEVDAAAGADEAAAAAPDTSRGDSPTDTAPPSEQPSEPSEQPAEQPSEQPAEQQAPVEPEPQAPAQPVVPEGPRIVTSTRRRGARRAAGPPRGEPSQSPI